MSTSSTALTKNLDIIGAEDKTELALKVKQYLAGARSELREKHIKDLSGLAITLEHTAIMDNLLETLFTGITARLPARNNVAFVALGGYGRGELNIHSDIDLMLLYDKKRTRAIEEIAESILYVLSDAGLDLGFSIRSIKDSVNIAIEDTKTMTAMIDSRLLFGDKALYEKLITRYGELVFSKKGSAEFIESKLLERTERHKKFGDSIYVLEPNVKESHGGLRDLHAALWVAKATRRGYFSAIEEGVMSAAEKRSLEESVDFLHWVRNGIHFQSGRKKDRLTFDVQEKMAKLRGHFDAKRELAVETFMRNYYLHATNISAISELIISRCLEPETGAAAPSSKTREVGASGDFVITGDVITATAPEVFLRDPSTLIRVFEYAQDYGAAIDRKTQDLILAALEEPGLALALPVNKAAGQSFKRILGGERLFETLDSMHRLKVLDCYIPEFADIRCKVQHDLYHIYTVDTHSIFAVRELEKLWDEYCSRYKLLTALLEDVEQRAELSLAVLLHDIGKAHGSGHAEKGAAMVPRICARIGFGKESTELVTFLVREHLILANTAQYRDLHDEKLIIDFAKTVGDDERLDLLYLLTFADVKAVGPEVWSEWKGTLFQELYFKARAVLEKGAFEPTQMTVRLDKLKSRVLARARLDEDTNITAAEIERHMKQLPPRYAFSNSPGSILAHIEYIKELDRSALVVKVRQVEDREYTELVVTTLDTSGLFAMITGVMMANSVNILGAQINTLRNGVALDLLQVNTVYGKLLTDEVKIKRIKENLKDLISGKISTESLIKNIRPSILDKKIKPAVPVRIEVDNDVSDIFTVLEIHTEDRLGLLYTISSALTSIGVIIHIAKVSTKGDTASDIFYIRDIFGQKINDGVKVDSIKKAVMDVLA